MNTVEFIKRYGWEEAKSTVNFFSGIFHKLDENENVIFTFQIDDLKQLVDAWELVHNFGGLKRAKRILKKAYTQFNTMVSVVWNDKPFQCTIEQLEQAIELVESVK